MMHKKVLFKLVFLTGLLLGICVPNAHVHSQRLVILESIEITLLPEIDPASIYVVYDITIAKNTPLPQEMVFKIPEDVTDFIVTNLDVNNLFQELETVILQGEEDQKLQFYALSHTFRIEYLDPNLRQEGAIRNYQFQWQSNYIVDSLKVTVRLPEGSNAIEFQPPLTEVEDEDPGFTYYQNEAGKIGPNETFSLMFWYKNISEERSIPAAKVQPAEPITNQTLGRAPRPFDVIIWLLMVAAAVVVLIVLYYLWYRNCVLNKDEALNMGVGVSNPEKQADYCPNCGVQIKAGNAYCVNCGAELRQPSLIDKQNTG